MSVSSNEIRETFLNYFVKKGHKRVNSSSLIAASDPSLLFSNAGMVQFKDIFTGIKLSEYSRVTNAQKCLRAGGKHNDLENVGFTKRHHTFFEMLGNFSFGDYFKEDAISFAWELITKEFGIEQKKLLITVHSSDEEAAILWKKIAGFSDDRIIRIDSDDNFWMMGSTGPCGTCTEIFYDHGEQYWGGIPGSKNEDGDRFIEIWNIVFMQYDKLANGEMVKLANPSIDTGMGLERIVAAMNGTNDNYDIDLFKNIMDSASSILDRDINDKNKSSFKIVADHIRAIGFMVADGILPSNEGRGYVLRRIMRRAMRHANILGAKSPILSKLIDIFIEDHGGVYPELLRAKELMISTLYQEEVRFSKTLERGLKLLDEEVLNLGSSNLLSGDVAFKLYDTYGFPLDLTQDALKDKQIAVDLDGFEGLMQKQKVLARSKWAGSGENKIAPLWIDLYDKFGASDFLGYKLNENQASIQAIVYNEELRDRLDFKDCKTNKKDMITLILNQSPFYGESGGQIGDQGVITSLDGVEFVVIDTKIYVSGLIAHIGYLKSGTLEVGTEVQAKIDTERRSKIKAHHSATHLLQNALQIVLGNHVVQKGSQVEDSRLRFDFSYPKPLTDEEIKQVELLVNEEIIANTKIETRIMSLEDAIEAGAMALFGEKYEEEVRVLFIGRKDSEDRHYSIELCGGTHVERSGEIGSFKIILQSALAAGVRRIEACCQENAVEYNHNNDIITHELSTLLKSKKGDIISKVIGLQDEIKNLSKLLEESNRRLAISQVGEVKPKDIKGTSFIGLEFDNMEAQTLFSIAEELKIKYKNSIIALSSRFASKVSIIVTVPEMLTEKYNACDLISKGAVIVNGRGGGRATFARAGGNEAKNYAKVTGIIEKELLKI